MHFVEVKDAFTQDPLTEGDFRPNTDELEIIELHQADERFNQEPLTEGDFVRGIEIEEDYLAKLKQDCDVFDMAVLGYIPQAPGVA